MANLYDFKGHRYYDVIGNLMRSIGTWDDVVGKWYAVLGLLIRTCPRTRSTRWAMR